MAERAPDLSFVVITYNDAGRLPRCLASAAIMSTAAGLDYEIFVVDNASRDHTGQVIKAFAGALGPRLKVIASPVNLGTTVSRNLALRQARGGMICVMDSDAELLDHSFARIKSLLDALPQVGIVAPTIILPDGHVYDSAKRLPTLADKLLKLPQIFLGAPPVNRDWYPGFPFPNTRCVDTAISCCWFFRRELLGRVGLLDERIFYAPEDVDYCLRCWKAGRAVVFYPHFRVLHHTRQTTHKRPLSATALSHLKGLLYYLHKHRCYLSRRSLVERHVEPLARELDPLLKQWEARP